MAKNTDIRYRNQLLYSVFVRDYGKNGTFKDVEQDLDRIRSLGTDIIWLMPIHPIGKIGRKGSIGSPYAISDYRAVNPDFGTINDFIQLTDEIHRSGMKCIIDVVYNHTSPDSVLSAEHPEWFYRDENGKPEAKVAEWWDIADLDYGTTLSKHCAIGLNMWMGSVAMWRLLFRLISGKWPERQWKKCVPALSGWQKVSRQALFKG